jgi:hypothetical protein
MLPISPTRNAPDSRIHSVAVSGNTRNVRLERSWYSLDETTTAMKYLESSPEVIYFRLQVFESAAVRAEILFQPWRRSVRLAPTTPRIDLRPGLVCEAVNSLPKVTIFYVSTCLGHRHRLYKYIAYEGQIKAILFHHPLRAVVFIDMLPTPRAIAYRMQVIPALY